MSTNRKKSPLASHRRVALGALEIIVSVALISIALYAPKGQQATSAAEPRIPAGVALTSWFENGKGGRHVLQIWRGAAPARGIRVSGTVATDTNCQPDAVGLSHCHNRIDVDDGNRIEVIHTHYMAVNPCLRPGQRVSIARIDKHWILASNGA